MKQFSRSLRVADEIQKEISKMFLFEINDPRIKNLTVTSVKLSPDLSLASVYVVSHEYDEAIVKTLIKASGFIKRNLAKVLKLRKIPEIHFYYDEVFETAIKIDKILYKIKDEDKKEEDNE